MSETSSHRILFMGTPEFAVPSLEALEEAGMKPMAVVTTPDRRRGRGQKLRPSAVKQAAKRLNIDTILQPESVKDPDFADQVCALEPDVIVVVAFKILPPSVFECARLGAFNLHGSLLPAYRGAAPINRAVMDGARVTGVTTFFLKEAVDTGNIILTREMNIGPNETAGELHDRMMGVGAEAVVETTRRILSGTADESPQDDALATPAPKIFREDCHIPWMESADRVHNHIRGLSPYPGAWTLYDGRQLKIFRSRIAGESGSHASPGTVLQTDDHVRVACAPGAVDVLEVQPEGKRRMTARDFLNGYDLVLGDRFE